MIIIGLTGGIASGKSTISETLTEMGSAVIDTDKLGHELLKHHGAAWDKLLIAFGDDILASNSDIDRKKLGKIVFNNPQFLQQLDSIMHPLIYQMVTDKIEYFRKQKVHVVVIEAALLLEVGWGELADEIWVTISPESTVLERLMNRDNITHEQAIARISSQIPPQERIVQADVVIDTSGTISQVKAKVKELWHNLQEKNGSTA